MRTITHFIDGVSHSAGGGRAQRWPSGESVVDQSFVIPTMG